MKHRILRINQGWPNIKQDCLRFVQSCGSCESFVNNAARNHLPPVQTKVMNLSK
eukprot:UN05943